jgi:AcrR family transcriptional regulator
VVALLDAADEIAASAGVKSVTLTSVTKAVGLHPSALRRYFESTEELLLELAERGWAAWRDELITVLDGRRGLAPAEAAEALAESLARIPVFCDLLTHAGMSLEGSVRLERARQYKLAATEAYDAMILALIEAVDGIDRAGGETILTTAMATASYLYQLSRPTDTLRELYAQEPRWAHSALRFREQLTTVLDATIRGCRSSDRRDRDVAHGDGGPVREAGTILSRVPG